MNASRLTILIAEDSATDRMLLATIVGRQGHRVLAASDGLEAVALFESQRPQLVLMDALMPVMDGFEAARRIKAMAGDAMVPIIFLTSLSEDEALVRCLEAGGDDFLAKPYSRVILEAKINAMDRLRRLHQEVLQQRDLIARHNEHLLNEQQVAKAVFDKVAHSGCLAAGNIRYMQSPYALFNGDLLLAAFHPSGDMHVLLGDFTGHGLPAAIGAMPLADVFYRMTGKGHSLAEILHESNAKLRRILPRGVFCCATVLNISFRRQVVEFWGGGLPDGYVLRKGGERVALVSRHLPLGVLEPDSFRDGYEAYPLELGDRVFLLSDGVLEAQNEHEELFGEQRLLDVLDNGHPPSALFDDIQRALQRFHGEARDDVSLVEVTMVEDSTVNRPPLTTGEWRAGLNNGRRVSIFVAPPCVTSIPCLTCCSCCSKCPACVAMAAISTACSASCTPTPSSMAYWGWTQALNAMPQAFQNTTGSERSVSMTCRMAASASPSTSVARRAAGV